MLIQIALSSLSALFFLIINSYLGFLSSVYGSLVSLINGYLIQRITKKQKKINIHNSSIALRIMIYSVITRFILIALLILIGLKLEIQSLSLLTGFIIGQIGLLIDTIKIKNGK